MVSKDGVSMVYGIWYQRGEGDRERSDSHDHADQYSINTVLTSIIRKGGGGRRLFQDAGYRLASSSTIRSSTNRDASIWQPNARAIARDRSDPSASQSK